MRRGRPACVSLVFLIYWLRVSWAEDDQLCLKRFKSSVTDPFKQLAGWTFTDPATPGSVCGFVGVSCWNTYENKVLALELPDAGLSGPFRPASLSSCASLQRLNLSRNSLSGPLPSTVFLYLPFLVSLDLSYNRFQGGIPPDLANCLYLNILHLQHNNLSGDIPWQLGTLPRLMSLNLSSNALSGPIPSSLTQYLSAATFAGNPLLCGSPGLSDCEAPASAPINLRIQLLISASIVLALLLFVALLLAFHWHTTLLLLLKPFCCPDSSNLPLFETHLNVRWEEVQRATSFFSPANIVGSGGSSTVYKGRLPDGQEIALKVLHNDDLGSELLRTPKQLFSTELRLLGKLRHRNLVKVLGFFCDSECMAIILDYMPAGSLNALLRHESATRNLAFGWKARLNILLGIAEGLAYLHDEYDGKLSVIHADLKPGNVLLDEYMEAHIADFGIATSVNTINNSSGGQVLSMPCWSLGYTAPECVQQGLVSCKGDVFSFGIIVLKMITGECPSSTKFKEGESLVEWVTETLAKGDIDRLIAPMLLNANEMMKWREELSATLRMGCSCTSMVRANRPNMSEVVIFLRQLCKKIEDNLPSQAPNLYDYESLCIVP